MSSGCNLKIYSLEQNIYFASRYPHLKKRNQEDIRAQLPLFFLARARKQLASREGHREADSQSISEQMDSNLKPSKLPILGNLEPKASIHRGRACLE